MKCSKAVSIALSCPILLMNSFSDVPDTSKDALSRCVFSGGTVQCSGAYDLKLKPVGDAGGERGLPFSSMDNGSFRTDSPVSIDGDMTAAAIFRTSGYGSMSHAENWKNGMILCSGSGYYDGWRILIHDPFNYRPVFEIGGTGGSKSVTAAESVSLGAWHMIAATWQSADSPTSGTARLYLDGKLAAETCGMPKPLKPAAPFAAGYVHFGVGSLKLDIAEAYLFDRALSGAEILDIYIESMSRLKNDKCEPGVRCEEYGNLAVSLCKRGTSGDKDKANRIWKEIASDKTAGTAHRYFAAVNAGLTPETVPWPKFYETEPASIPEFNETEMQEINVSPDALPGGDGSAAKPFCTIAEALDAAARLRGENPPPNGVKIVLHEGTYRIGSTLKINGKLSGKAASPTLITAAKDQTAIIDGGITIPESSFSHADPGDKRFPEAAADSILRTDLKKPPRAACDALKPYSRGGCVMISENGNKLMRPARWPENGFLSGEKISGTEIRLPEDAAPHASAWSGTRFHAHGYWKYLWSDQSLPVEASVDGTVIKLLENHNYGLGDAPKFYVHSLPQELDSPGEWYLDTEEEVLYLIPYDGDAFQFVSLSCISEPLLDMSEAVNTHIRGITFRNTYGNAVSAGNTESCSISGCKFESIGGTAVTANNANEFVFSGCSITDTGLTGIILSAGDRKTLRPGKSIVRDCNFKRTGRYIKTYTPGVLLDGCGNVIRGNSFSDMPSSAMRIEGNNHIIEHNDVSNVVLESDDQGAVDMWGDASYRRCVFRENTFSDVGAGDCGFTSAGRAAIRFDDAICGMLVYSNIFINTSAGNFGAVQIHGGNNNYIFDNIIYDCANGISFSPWGKDRWLRTLDKDDLIRQRMYKMVDSNSEIYRTAYPELARIRKDFDKNMIWHNTFIGCGSMFRNLPREASTIWNTQYPADENKKPFMKTAH